MIDGGSEELEILESLLFPGQKGSSVRQPKEDTSRRPTGFEISGLVMIMVVNHSAF